ncbi:hypothetical protein AB5I41_16035 [Sphingomonas sp. MMS24-JH45]
MQFHPESIATEHGHDMLANFLTAAGIAREKDGGDDDDAPSRSVLTAVARDGGAGVRRPARREDQRGGDRRLPAGAVRTRARPRSRSPRRPAPCGHG